MPVPIFLALAVALSQSDPVIPDVTETHWIYADIVLLNRSGLLLEYPQHLLRGPRQALHRSDLAQFTLISATNYALLARHAQEPLLFMRQGRDPKTWEEMLRDTRTGELPIRRLLKQFSGDLPSYVDAKGLAKTVDEATTALDASLPRN